MVKTLSDFQEIAKLLTENEDWLMDEAGPETETDVFKKRYLDMKTAMNRVENRIDEHKRKLEEERRKKEAEEKAKKEAEEKAKKEAEEAKKKEEEEAKKEEEAMKSQNNTEAENVEMGEVPSDVNVEAPKNPSEPSDGTAETPKATNEVDEGMCSLNGCNDGESTEL